MIIKIEEFFEQIYHIDKNFIDSLKATDCQISINISNTLDHIGLSQEISETQVCYLVGM